MLRSIRISFLASVVALAFAACGGGSNPPNNQQDAGTGDGPHIQFDGPRSEGGTPQQDAGGGGDGGAVECVATGGVATGGICKASKPCTCPNTCAPAFETTYAGSCWPEPDPTNGCATATDVAVYVDVPENSHCFPTATLTGSFSVPFGTQATMGGTVSATLTINGQTFTVAQGWVEHDTTNGWREVVLLPTNLSTPPVNWIRMIIADAKYVVGTADMAISQGDNVVFLYSETANSQTLWGMNHAGSVSLTAVDTGSGGTVTGTFNVTMFAYPMELCGPNTTAC
jgi:hypothetical protein